MMKRILAFSLSVLLLLALSSCTENPATDPAGTEPAATEATAAPVATVAGTQVVLGAYEMHVPVAWQQTESDDENTLHFHFADNGEEGDCVIAIQAMGSNAPGQAVSYIELMWNATSVMQSSLGEHQAAFADFQLSGAEVSVVAFQDGSDVVITFVQGLTNASRRQELAKAVAETIQKTSKK